MGRVGTHRSDRRWKDEQGNEWASRFEYRVYDALKNAGYNIRRCSERDSIMYSTQVKGGACLDCSSSRVVQARTYTADLYVLGSQREGIEGGYLLELKGYFDPAKRTLFRAVSKQVAKEGVNLRIVFESGKKMRGTKLTGPEYIHKYCKNVIPGVFDKKTEEVVWFER